MQLRTCVTPQGHFRYAVHQPSYRVPNLRQSKHLLNIGSLPDGTPVRNEANFPAGEVRVNQASTVYEIPNIFAFRGSTFIDACWAAPKASDPESIRIDPPEAMSMRDALRAWSESEKISWNTVEKIFGHLPRQVLLALATTSSDQEELIILARMSCDFQDEPGEEYPCGLAYTKDGRGQTVPVIHDRELFEAVANNDYLPDKYKEVMVLRPGVQGGSEIVGDYSDQASGTHIFEYLRRNSYIPWGHYAANMADDAVRYRIRNLSLADMLGLRHLYYQRIFMRLAAELNMDFPQAKLNVAGLEQLRQKLASAVQERKEDIDFSCTLWGWNFGFDYSPTGYRLHASHQQIHQQNAMIPDKAKLVQNGNITGEAVNTFACGDMVAEVVRTYEEETGQEFFEDLIRCLRSNKRTDGQKGEHDLIVYEDENVLLFVPKAQVSQWELQLMPKNKVGNVLEADSDCRFSLDKAMLMALRILEEMGAKMVTCIEFSKRFTVQQTSQRLLYSFLPRLPWSPGSFSEAQQRFICGHFPEDFAAACRRKLDKIIHVFE